MDQQETQETFQLATINQVNNYHFLKGADISHVTDMEQKNLLFYNTTDQQDLFLLIKERGLNSVRLRVWVNPVGPYYYNSIADVVAKAIRAKALGLSVILSFHYSDSWADPKKQNIPAAWMGYTLLQMQTALANHTKDCLNALQAQGITPLYVQVGNETDYGMLWPIGDIRLGNMSNYAALHKAGYEAVKEVNDSIQVMVHFSKGKYNDSCRYVLDGLLANDAIFDLIGISVYPILETYDSDIEASLNNLEDLSSRYGKEVMVVECGYYQNDPQRAREMIFRLLDGVATLPESKGLGVYYWEPQYYQRPPINKSIFDATTKSSTVGIDGFSLVQNPGFEVDEAAATNPASWQTGGSNPDANYLEGGPHTGSYRLTHFKNSGYNVETKQTISGLTNGLYTLQAWVRSGTGLIENYLFAKDFGGAMLKADIMPGSTWIKLRIENIPISNGECTIGMYTQGNNQYSSVDNFQFFKQ
ncbi:glycosyl hydrolase 53 family protein [Sphingobacterium chuzhouense]|uniref:Arabinogalactan endo-beta-1,4-galactanase n=1 Tax=Sphingobacterium chuzhouense TaxID=1742264 RepID=A0ABR7XNT6_9SPHI|nr:glycosyl hydrolase 53 family protein [Sphingobacterium chuzhouense]MBD1420838.1 glycosyl hydrolase 53 family protein [Sphingobacterium chuzhouense]